MSESATKEPRKPLRIVGVAPAAPEEAERIQRAYNELVYHYTSADALLSIVTKRKLWLTGTEFVNDTYEFQQPTLRLQHMVENPGAAMPWAPPSTPATHYQALAMHLRTNVLAYAASFSRVGNSLSQFRMYGQGGGYSIGFPRSFLQRVAAEISVGNEPTQGAAAITDCEYSHEALEKFCQAYASDFLYAADKCDPDGKKEPGQIWDEIYGTTRLYECRLLAQMRFKSSQFAVEEEVRLFKFGHLGKDGSPLKVERCWRTSRGGNYVVPYIEIDLPNEPILAPLSAGPNLDNSLAAASCAQALYAARKAGTLWEFATSGSHNSGFRVGL